MTLPPDAEIAPETPPGVDPDDFAAMLRYVGLAANTAAIEAIEKPRSTAADITHAAVRAAFELALRNGLITIVGRDQWPRYIALNPPYTYTGPGSADGTGVVREP